MADTLILTMPELRLIECQMQPVGCPASERVYVLVSHAHGNGREVPNLPLRHA